MDKLNHTVISKIKACLDALDKSSVMKGFARRDGQMSMVNDIRQILNSEHSKIAVCEAGTGVGKTLAYLLATVPTAKAQGKSVVISTATVALQEQILKKDLPMFQSIYPDAFTFAVAKGKGRFVCIERLQSVISNASGMQQEMDFGQDVLFDEPVEQEHIDIVTEMSDKLSKGLWDGDKDTWTGARLPDFVWTAIASDQYQCKSNFKKHAHCPYHTNREALFSCDVIVANHALVARDLEIGGGILLPSTDDAIYVFDEAHQLPEVVRSAKASTLNCQGFASVIDSLKKVHSSRKMTKAIDVSKASKFISDLDSGLRSVTQDLNALSIWSEEAAIKYLSEKSLYRFEFGRLPTHMETLVNNMSLSLKSVTKVLTRVQNELTDLAKEGNTAAEASLSDVGFYLGRLNHSSDCLNILLAVHDGQIQPAKWIERDSKERFCLGAGEVSVGNYLKDTLWDNNSGIILTSATLCSLGSFNDFARDTGLDFDQSAYFRRYSSPFKYHKSKLLLPKSLPFEPNTDEFKVWLKTNIKELFTGYKSSLVLFTSRALMEEVRTQIENSCTTTKILLQCQGDAPRSVIVENHKKALDRGLSSVIFGLDSFSEGLDLQNDLLENLIITRIPFEMPDSPLTAALVEFEKSMGNMPFYTVTLPAASRALQQSVGRLIRSESDVGRCLILDKRIITKRYGSDLLAALPPFTQEYF